MFNPSRQEMIESSLFVFPSFCDGVWFCYLAGCSDETPLTPPTVSVSVSVSVRGDYCLVHFFAFVCSPLFNLPALFSPTMWTCFIIGWMYQPTNQFLGCFSNTRMVGSLINQPTDKNSLPEKVPGLVGKTVVQVACGCYHTVALNVDGRVFPFGRWING